MLDEGARERRAQDAQSTPPPPTAMATGAAAALTRLETAEANAYSAVERAALGGDLFELKQAREGWLKVSEALRRSDAQIEASRRETGELIPRRSVAAALTFVAMFLRFSIIQTARQVAEKVQGAATVIDARKVLENSLFSQLAIILAGYKVAAKADRLAPTLIDVFVRDLDNAFTGTGDAVNTLAPALSEMFNEALAGALAHFAEADEARRNPPPARPPQPKHDWELPLEAQAAIVRFQGRALETPPSPNAPEDPAPATPAN